MTPPKLLAFYLPQYHEIPENDVWWGKGFTEWTNVRKAEVLFSGHRQPRVPLGDAYYALDDAKTLVWQAELLNKYRLDGLCFYHYWFGGKLLLEKPLALLLENPDISMPFCMAWANQDWTKAWNDGGDREVIMPQAYGGEAEWSKHFDYLQPAFTDARYIKVDGKPVFLVYLPRDIPDVSGRLAYFDNRARECGLPGMHFVNMKTSYSMYEGMDFAANVDFEPMYTTSHGFGMVERGLLKLKRVVKEVVNSIGVAKLHVNTRSYESLWNKILSRKIEKNTYPGAFLDWDNTARKGERGLVVTGANPDTFHRYFAKQYARAVAAGSSFIFVNAWNEWAEGTYLEPDEEFKFGYLEAIKATVEDAAKRERMSE